jgi:hypothetical protein
MRLEHFSEIRGAAPRKHQECSFRALEKFSFNFMVEYSVPKKIGRW